MYSKADIISGIEQIGVMPTDTLLVHSSMKAVGLVEGRADTVLDAFIEYMREGMLILPTHTWAYVGEEGYVFDVRNSPSCVGILTNLFRRREGVIRSMHPSHSVAALGKDAASYVSGEEQVNTPCPRQGCWGKLYDRRAKILFLGCGLDRNTFIHGVEEWFGVPNRIAVQAYTVNTADYDGYMAERSMYGHSGPPGVSVSNNYIKLETPFLYKGIAHRGHIGDAESILCDAVDMADLTAEFLRREPNLFGGDSAIPEEWYKS